MSKIIKIYNRAKEIIENENLTWEQRYHLIFSNEISSQVGRLDYYDPDSDYDDDVRAWFRAFEEYLPYLIEQEKNKSLLD